LTHNDSSEIILTTYQGIKKLSEHEPSERPDNAGLITSIDLPPAGTAQPQQEQERFTEPDAAIDEARKKVAEVVTESRYRPGDKVTVKRSDGRFEAGWTVDEIKEDRIYVVRPDITLESGKPKVLDKQVTAAELDGWRVEANDPIPGLKVGDPVKVLRSSGQLEHGWLFAGYEGDGATVQSIDPDPTSGQYLFKHVSIGVLASWQWQQVRPPAGPASDAGETGRVRKSLLDRFRNK
jgi:hypothetical protein